jgi:hypothetical protein
MKRQIRNAIHCMAIMAFAGVGLLAYGQTVEQTVQQQSVQQPVVTQQPVGQTCTQPTVIQTVQDFVVQPQPQPVVAAAPTTSSCADMCELVRAVERDADDLRKYFRRSVRCLECADDAYYDSVKEFERATDRLKRHYKHNCDQCDVTGDVQEVLALANCISKYMDPCSLCPEATEAWTALQCDLQTLAGQFCTTASFQQPISLACPVPVCAQPTCAQPAPVVVQPVQPAPVVVQPTCPAPVVEQPPAPVIFK